MYITAINRGFVVMTELFNYTVEAVFSSEVVDINFKGQSVTVAMPREILLYDKRALKAWIEKNVVLLVERVSVDVDLKEGVS
jgi:hypothetical protein